MELVDEKSQETNREAILKSILFWIGGLIISVFIMSLGTYREDFLVDYVALYYSINVTATIMLSGVPLVLTSLLLLTPRWKRESIVRRINEGQSKNLVYLRTSVEVILLNTVVMVGISFVMVLVSGVPMSFLLALTVTGFILSLLLSPLVVFLTLSLNHAIASICCVFAIFWTLSFLYGMTPFQVSKGEESLLHPYHLYRFIAVIFSGVEFEGPFQMAIYMGFLATPETFVLPLLFWSTISICTLVAGALYFPRAVEMWDIESEVVWKTAEEERGKSLPFDHTRIKKTFVKNQRYVVGVLFVLILFIAGLNYVQTGPLFVDEHENEEILYQSPIGGEEIAFGLWLYGEVDFSQATVEGEPWKSMRVEVINWGGAPQDIIVSMSHNLVPMTLSELLNLNETERAELFGSTSRGIDRDDPESGGGWTSVDDVGVNVWGIRFFNEEHAIEEFTFAVRITITVRGE